MSFAETYTFIDVLFKCLENKAYLEAPKEEPAAPALPLPPPPPVDPVIAVKLEPSLLPEKTEPVAEQPDRRSESRKRKDEVGLHLVRMGICLSQNKSMQLHQKQHLNKKFSFPLYCLKKEEILVCR